MRMMLSVALAAALTLAAASSFAETSSDKAPTVLDTMLPLSVSAQEAATDARSDTAPSPHRVPTADIATASNKGERTAYAQSLRNRGQRQIFSTPAVLLTGGVLMFPLLLTGFPDGNCERNKVSCSSYSVGDFSSVGDDIGVGFAFASATTALAGTGMLLAIGARNLDISNMDTSDTARRVQRSVMLQRYGRRTQWAAVGVVSSSAIAALVGGVLYANNHDRCELDDCPVVPGATKTIVTSAIIGTVTGGMMLGVGTRARTRGARGPVAEQKVSLAFSPYFVGDGGGSSMSLVW